ncbi:ATP-grasp domain-containing protein [Rhizobium sp. BK176]|uniref:ATP-grasp domain-containing protein n=1 Tax=Rhizobium sp. BK176 TaxID=2587071 RepID=UPI0021690552|nr:ATP-grasp domain-containing protein [Rhizobium sp. BK176]MCS4089705.1 hypothetical protein [Rhizobium sp. BK176]
MLRAAFRLTENTDPEERLEEAALWKAMHDHYGPDGIVAVRELSQAPDGLPMFGRTPKFPVQSANPVSDTLEYWTDRAFLAACRREFYTVPFEAAEKLVRGIQARGKGAFIKSTSLKHYTAIVQRDGDFREALGDMAYSFMDGGPLLMVQELATIEYEYRYFAIDGRIVTSSPNMTALTPIDYPLPPGTVYRTPHDPVPERRHEILQALSRLAANVASSMAVPHACIDVAMINGGPGIVEMNPMQIGQVGLFACDVRALARASETLVASYVPEPAFGFGQSSTDEEDFNDFGP